MIFKTDIKERLLKRPYHSVREYLVGASTLLMTLNQVSNKPVEVLYLFVPSCWVHCNAPGVDEASGYDSLSLSCL